MANKLGIGLQLLSSSSGNSESAEGGFQTPGKNNSLYRLLHPAKLSTEQNGRIKTQKSVE